MVPVSIIYSGSLSCITVYKSERIEIQFGKKLPEKRNAITLHPLITSRNHTMQFRFHTPSTKLRPYIRSFWNLECGAGEPTVTERVIPTGSFQMMFHYRNPFRSVTSEGKEQQQPRTLISGPGIAFSDVSTTGASGVWAVVFEPAFAGCFLPCPAGEIGNQTLSLGEIFQNEIAQLEEELFLASQDSKRIGLIESFLLRHFRPLPHYMQKLALTAIRHIHDRIDGFTSSDLAYGLGLSPRSLERHFASLVGTTPKHYMQLIRFRQTTEILMKGQYSDLTELGLRQGYYDQSHFIREFKAYSGYTPGEFARICCRPATD